MNQNISQESEITLGLLRAVEDDASLTQRGAAQELGIALGLVNTYFKRCIKKGLIKAQQVPANRYSYYLTPKGFAEKSRLAAEFLTQTMSLFRQAQNGYEDVIKACVSRGLVRIALVGASDLAQLVLLFARNHPVTIVGVIDAEARQTTGTFHGIPVFASLNELPDVDAFIMSGLHHPQEDFNQLIQTVPPGKVFAPDLLDIATSIPDDMEETG